MNSLTSSCRTFAACPSVKVVVVVSCCYNLVTEAPTETPAGKALAPTERPKLNLRKSVPEPSGPFQNGPAGNSRRSPHCPQPGPTKELTNRSDCSENTSAGDLQEPFNSPKIGPSEIRQEPPDTLQPGLSGSEQSAPNLTENGQKPSIPPNTALSSLSPPRRSADPDARDGDSALESCSGCLSNPGNASCQISEPGGSSSGACSHQLYGFPLSAAVKAMGFRGLGINGRMLACQSAARWRAQSEEGFADVITKHTLRAAFQALLKKHFPAVWATKPVLGKQKKRPVGGVPCGNGTSVGGIANGNGSSVGGNPNGNGTSVGGNPNGNGSLVGGNPNGNGSPVGGLPSGNRRSLGRPPISGAPVVDNGSSVSNEETVGESEPKNDMRQNGACDRMSGSGSERQEARPDVKSDRCFKVSNDVLRGSRPSREASSSSTGEKRGQSDLKSLPSVPSSPGSLPNRANEACIGTAVGAEAELRNRRFPATSRVSDDERTSPESARERARFVEFATESLQQLGLPGVSENEIGDVWESLRSSKVKIMRSQVVPCAECLHRCFKPIDVLLVTEGLCSRQGSVIAVCRLHF